VITPDMLSDAVDFPQPFRSLYVGTGGTVQIVTATGVVLPHVNVASGATIICAGKRINVTGTTALNMIGYL
jgi:hypothetical protein